MTRACLLALLLSVLALGPTLLPGRGLLPQDVRTFAPFASALDAAELEALRDESVPQRRDKLLQFLPFDHAVGKAWRAGHVPLWSSDIFCGVPLLAEMTSRGLYPTALAFALFPPQAVYAWTYLAHLVLGGAFAFRIVRRLGGTTAGGHLAVSATVLSGYAVAHCHHPMIYFAAVWCLPALDATLALLGVGRTKERATPRNASIVLTLSVTLSWFAGFSQASILLCYLVAWIAAIHLAHTTWRERRLPWRPALRIVLPTTVGILLALPQLLPTLEASHISSRRQGTREELAQAALPTSQLLEYVLPGQLSPEGDIVIEGEGPKPSYLAVWLTPTEHLGDLSASRYNFTETALTIGLAPLAFALSSLLFFLRRRTNREAFVPPPDRRTLSALWISAGFGLCAALAVPGIFWLAVHLPGFAVGDLKRLTWLPSLALPLLAGLGFTTCRRRLVNVPLLVTGLLVLTFSLVLWRTNNARFEEFFGDRYQEKFGGEIKAGFLAIAKDVESTWNKEHLAAGFLRLGLALTLGAALSLFGTTRSAAWIIATAVELLPLAWNVTPAPTLAAFDERLPIGRVSEAEPGSPAQRWLRVEPEAPSVASVQLLPANLGTLWNLAEVTGYVPLPAKRSEAFFEGIEPGSTSRGAGLSALRNARTLASPWLPLLAPDHLAILGEPIDVPGWTIETTLGRTTFYRSVEPLPRARLYFAHEVVESTDAMERLLRLAPEDPGSIDPLRTLVLEHTPTRTAQPNATGRIHEVTYATNSIRVRYEATGDAHLLVSEAWAPGWHVFVDGEDVQRETEPGQVMFQTVTVPAGEHTVELRYAPRGFRFGVWIAIATLAALLVTAFVRWRRR